MFYLHFVEKQKKSVETTKTLLQIFLLHSSTDHSFCLVVLGNNDDNKKVLLKSYFFACDSCGILLKSIKHLLITVIIVISNQIAWSRKNDFLSFRFSCLFSNEIFNVWKSLFCLIWPVISRLLEINSFDILYCAFQISHQNRIFF